MNLMEAIIARSNCELKNDYTRFSTVIIADAIRLTSLARMCDKVMGRTGEVAKDAERTNGKILMFRFLFCELCAFWEYNFKNTV